MIPCWKLEGHPFYPSALYELGAEGSCWGKTGGFSHYAAGLGTHTRTDS